MLEGQFHQRIQLLKKNDEKTSHEPNIVLVLQISWVTSTESSSESEYAWPSKFNMNALRVDVDIFESAKDDWRIHKYPDTCGRGLNQAQNCNYYL